MKPTIIIFLAMSLLVGAGFLTWRKDTASLNDDATKNIQAEDQNQSLELEDNEWVWLYTELQNGQKVTAPEGNEFVISFDSKAGRIVSRTDCNSLSGIFAKDGEVLSMGEFVSTKMYCEGSMEGVYVDHLALVNSFVIEGKTLRLIQNRDYGVMVF